VRLPVKGWTIAIVAAGAILFGDAASLSAQAGDEAPAIVAYRKAIMNSNSRNLASLRALVSGEVDLPDHIRMRAAALAENGRMMMTQAIAGTHDVFPEGSLHSTSRASEEIWARSGDFTEANRAFAVAASNLETVAQRGSMDEIQEALTATQQTCGSCHGEFRGPAL